MIWRCGGAAAAQCAAPAASACGRQRVQGLWGPRSPGDFNRGWRGGAAGLPAAYVGQICGVQLRETSMGHASGPSAP